LVIILDKVEFEDRQKYEVENILNYNKDAKRVLHYRVKWAGFDDPKDDTWELVEHFSGTSAKVKEYWQSQKKTH
jgi:hypothetical protein